MEKRHITSAISQLFGKFASKEFPKWFQVIVNQSYVSLMGLDMSEFQSPSSYKSLNALFTRRLNKDREFSKDPKDFIAPCDSWVSELGPIRDDYALQIKGMRYKCSDLIGNKFSDKEKNIIRDGEFINFYLSPKDYHRYHMPTDAKILKAVHIPGKFYPVNVPSLKKKLNLFVENERVVIFCETMQGKKFYMVLVSALNVGVMKVSFDPRIQTNASATTPQVYEFENLTLKKGEDFGCFEMGSTIVLLAQKDMFADIHIEQNEHIKYAQTIGHLKL